MKRSEVELDFIVTKEGVTIYCTRIKSPTFIPFDTIYDLPSHCFFKIKNKGRIFNIQHGVPQCAAIPVIQNIQSEKNNVLLPITPPRASPPPQKKIKKEELPTEAEEEFDQILQEFFDNIGTTKTATQIDKEKIEVQNTETKDAKERQKRSTSDPPPFIENKDNSPLSYRFSDAVNSQSF
ncbi:hypothetical protein ACQ4LE_009962 [Meloidogyne hapla]|uniref:Uncharacterized protein n=1 Tax=Meloidogyne hapla TaxID=6305 RepID=A0A1I8AY26_MELHA